MPFEEGESKGNSLASACSISAEAFSSIGEREGVGQDLKEIAKTLRRHIITMTAKAGSGHPGGSLSSVELGYRSLLARLALSPFRALLDGARPIYSQ